MYLWKLSTIMELITFSIKREINVCSIRKPFIKKQHPSIKVKQSLVYKSVFLYNSLPEDLRTFNPKKLTKHLCLYVLKYFSNNLILKNDNLKWPKYINHGLIPPGT